MVNKQSKLLSALEAIINVFTGAFLSIAITELLAPYLGIHITLEANLKLTVILTVVSILRGYFWRRLFNRLV
jgi:hypothetical protein